MADDELRHELDELVEEINRRVDERRRNGDYPLGLEEELDRHFRELVHPPDIPRAATGPAHQSLGSAIDRPRFSRAEIDTRSGIPGGQLIHKVAGKVVSRQVAGTLDQVQAWRNEVQGCLQSALMAIDAYAAHTHGDLRDSLSGALDRIVVIDRLEAMVLDFDDRLSAIEARLNEREQH